MDIYNRTIIIKVNQEPLFEGEGNCIISTDQFRESYIKVNNVDKRHGGKQKIHDDNRIINLKLHNSLLYFTIIKPTQWDLDNIHRIHLTSYQTWDPECLNNDTKAQVIYQGQGGADYDLENVLRIINTSSLDLHVNISDRDTVDTIDRMDNHHHVSFIYTKTNYDILRTTYITLVLLMQRGSSKPSTI